MGEKQHERKVLVPGRTITLARALGNQFLILRALRKIETLEADAKARIEIINKRKAARVSALSDLIRKRTRSLLNFFFRNHYALTERGQKKTAHIEGGDCEWFEGNWSIEVSDEKAAIAWLEKIKEEKALRRTVELNKTYLHDNPDLVEKTPGIRRVQKPMHFLRFPGTRTRVEHSPVDDTITIVIPKKKE